MAKYNIGGVIFEDEATAKTAAKELKAVEYILNQLKSADDSTVLKVYKKLIDQKMFTTEIGLSFLAQLHDNLLSSGTFKEGDIPPIYELDTISFPKSEASNENPSVAKIETEITDNDTVVTSTKPKKQKKKAVKSSKSADVEITDQYIIKKLRFFNRVLLVVCVTLLICVLGMFYVNSTINSPTILNYEEKIQDEYASWAQELAEKEQALNDREKELLGN
ncbi:MAG: hypothetical protein K5773_00625 [Pseudobutyrivibrio sp.]|nr:hypothetical protein [Pseudobutyrivibrio sp.]